MAQHKKRERSHNSKQQLFIHAPKNCTMFTQLQKSCTGNRGIRYNANYPYAWIYGILLRHFMISVHEALTCRQQLLGLAFTMAACRTNVRCAYAYVILYRDIIGMAGYCFSLRRGLSWWRDANRP
ncbi:hypothetical protein GDO78_004395 [Eleutherodactylus coqui]|uniref:Uncharacterized protein n=1 Tax=Eleutherodactylus coqui TaxID=57060 RepID=A0A8J6ERZ1_ELECQ|nr:hypothetical protein GDO78_004395 [Eleutherodactylus coqui]